LNIGKPSDFGTRTWRKQDPEKRPRNSYERGIPVSRRPDGSEVPYLRADGEIMRQKEFDAKSHLIEENKRRAHNATASTS
jgi:hypothetical protein